LKTSNYFIYNDRPFIKFCFLLAAGGCHPSKEPRFFHRGTTWTTATGPSTGSSAQFHGACHAATTSGSSKVAMSAVPSYMGIGQNPGT
jgi:hypothetical protein